MPGHNVQSSRARFAVRATAERATWLPGLDPPAYLDGTSVTRANLCRRSLQVAMVGC